MSKCTNCDCNFVGTPESMPEDGLCKYCKIEQLTKELDQLAAKVAEMRKILCRWDDYTLPHGQSTWSETFSIVFLEKVQHAISDQCGIGWISPDKAKIMDDMFVASEKKRSALMEALRRIQNYPVHSEPVGGAYEMQNIAHKALEES